MSLRINNNDAAATAHRQLARTSEDVATSMRRLASGQRVNTAADDAAGLALSERMRSQIGGLQQAIRNTQDGISFVQTAEAHLDRYHAVLARVRDLAMQYNNGVLATPDRMAIATEVSVLGNFLGQSNLATFNGISLVGTTPGVPVLTLQVGANAGEVLAIQAGAFPAASAAVGMAFTQFAGGTATYIDLAIWDTAIDLISQMRTEYGVIQNRLEHTLNALSVQQEQVMSAESRIRDTDIAAETTNMTAAQIRQQAGTAMLASAQQSSAILLRLLQ